MGADRHRFIWRISLAQIEATVSAHLGPGRVAGNASGPCLSRQVSMYLAKHVGGWSLPKIGRFYNGQHHTTVLHAIAKVERLRKTDDAFDALLDVLTDSLAVTANNNDQANLTLSPHSELIDAVAQRVLDRLKEELQLDLRRQQIDTSLLPQIQLSVTEVMDQHA